MHLTRPLTLLVAVAALSSAACKKTDAERAAAERAEMREELGDSYALVPYRVLKLATRAQGAPNSPPELQRLIDQTIKISQLTQEGGAKADAEAVLRLAVLAWETRTLLERHDEDEYPVLWSRFQKEPPPAWWDNGSEHLAIAFIELVGQMTAVHGKKDSSLLTFAAYELSRAEPGPAWPAPLRLAARLERGIYFAAKGRHYAADEELTAYLAELDEGSARLLLADVPGQKNPFRALRGVGRLARGWNRYELDRKELALDDLVAGLEDLEAAGLDNELTQWVWAVVHAQRGDTVAAAAKLDRLARSPYLDEAARAELAELAECAGSLRTSGKLPGPIARGRAMILIGRALVARAGGVEEIATLVLGPERAQRLLSPVSALVELQERVADASDPERLAGQAKAAGGKLVEGVKARWNSGDEAKKE
ncbi:MAG TPA: hypothetical protein VEB43_16700 [Anaeromyxobacter sp.]|nr:hypothetical protein [Anaeromyxobacter sp.]